MRRCHSIKSITEDPRRKCAIDQLYIEYVDDDDEMHLFIVASSIYIYKAIFRA